MRTIGIISEYNPFHSGHRYHIEQVRRQYGDDSAVVCVMSGNWVQRGDAAVTDKWTRARMALEGGADLILELPTLWAVSSAETFARAGVALLDAAGCVNVLSFGSEAGALPPLESVADCLRSEAFRAAPVLPPCSYTVLEFEPEARQDPQANPGSHEPFSKE